MALACNECKNYYRFLTSGIDDLERLFISSGESMSIQFLKKTLSFLRSVNTQFTLLAQKLPLSSGDKWLDEYMKESNKFWKLCNILKSAISNMDTFCSNEFNFINILNTNQYIHNNVLIHHQEQVMNSIDICKTMAIEMEVRNGMVAFNPIRPVPINFDDINKMNEFKVIEFNGFRGVLYAMRNVSSLLLSILVYGLMNYSPENSYFIIRDEELSGRLLFGSGCLISMERLQRRVATTENRGLLMDEFKRAMAAVEVLEERLKETRGISGGVNWRTDVEIRKKLDDLKACLEKLKSGSQNILVDLHDFIDEVMEEREKMLDLSVSKQTSPFKRLKRG